MTENVTPMQLIEAILEHARNHILELPSKRYLPAVFEIVYSASMRAEMEEFSSIIIPEALAELRKLQERLSRQSKFDKWFHQEPKRCLIAGQGFEVSFVTVPNEEMGASFAVRHRFAARDLGQGVHGTVLDNEEEDVSTPPCEAALELTAKPPLAVIEAPGQPPYEMREPEVLIGRSENCRVRTNGHGVSREHVQLRYVTQSGQLEGRACSRNWTALNGQIMDRERSIPLPAECSLSLAGATEVRIRSIS